MPLPGFITCALWAIVVVALKILVLPKTFLPYALFYGGALVELILLWSAFGVALNQVSSYSSAARLLAATETAIPDYLSTSLILLVIAVVLNYVFNCAYLIFFFRYIKPEMVLSRQINIITNYVALALGCLTTYRFALIPFSKMFVHPSL